MDFHALGRHRCGHAAAARFVAPRYSKTLPQQTSTVSWLFACSFNRLRSPNMESAALHGAWDWYKLQLSARPLRTQIITSGILWAAGDVLAQGLSFCSQQHHHPHLQRSHLNHNHNRFDSDAFSVDWKRVLTLSVFGAAFVAPVGHLWYERLDYVVSKHLNLRTGSFRFIVVKLVADTLIYGPLHLLAFLTYMGIASRKNLEDVKGILKREFIPAFVTEGSVWPFVQAVNFRFVPVQHQLLYVNGFCLIDSVFLSWFKHQEDAAWKRWVMSFVSSKLT